MNRRWVRWLIQGIVCGGVLSSGGLSAIAQSRNCDIQPAQERGLKLICAQIYEVTQSVRLKSRVGAALVQSGAIVLPEESLETLAGSIAELQFNEGSIARMSERTVFEFIPGLRQFNLIDGTLLAMSPPGTGPIEVETAVARVRPLGTAIVVQHQAATQGTIVIVLTNNPKGLVTVLSKKGEKSIQLKAGQLIAVTEQGFGSIQNFDLKTFYQTNPLVVGLAPGQEAVIAKKPAKAQKTYTEVRSETLAAVNQQKLGFAFLDEALHGIDSDFDRPSKIRNVVTQQSVSGRFNRLTDTTGSFAILGGPTIPINVDLDNRSLTIGGISGREASAGLSGNNAVGTIVIDNEGTLAVPGFAGLQPGESIGVEILDVNGSLADPPSSYPGNLIRTIAPDR